MRIHRRTDKNYKIDRFLGNSSKVSRYRLLNNTVLLQYILYIPIDLSVIYPSVAMQLM